MKEAHKRKELEKVRINWNISRDCEMDLLPI